MKIIKTVHIVLQVTDEERKELGESISIRMGAIYPTVARILTHNDLDSNMIALAIKKLQYVIKEFGRSWVAYM